jgi:hypothetical protein
MPSVPCNNRSQPEAWVAQEEEQRLLPIRAPDGTLVAPRLLPEELEERRVSCVDLSRGVSLICTQTMQENRRKREAEAETSSRGPRKRLEKGGAVVEVVPVHRRCVGPLSCAASKS